MIIVESIPDRPELVKRYSNIGMFIQNDQTGGKYAEAVDLAANNYTYTETNEPVDDEPLEAQEALDIIFGGNDDTV